MRNSHLDGSGFVNTKARGMAVLTTPLLNKGTAFTLEEREELGLTGLLPPVISTLEGQVKAAYAQYQRLPDALNKNIYLTALHDRNEVLFYRLLSGHLREMIPIVNDLTVGMAMQQYHHECRRPRGVYLSIDHLNGIEAAFANLGAGPEDIDLILATDAEQILGLGDWGVGGIEISIGKLAIYTAAGGIDPTRVIPVMLDVGTNRESLLKDPMYVGNRHARIRGERYDAFMLEKYRNRVSTFNDDMQGTGTITLAAAVSAVRVCGSPMRNQRVVILGAGTAGLGIADQIRDAMMREGLSQVDATARFWLVDASGLLTDDMGERLQDYQAPYARPNAEVRRWKRSRSDGASHETIDLAETVRQVRPTMLIGTSTAAGAFTEDVVRDMAKYCERPIIFPLSSPAPMAEATPADLIAWTEGRALIATGSPFQPVTYRGVTYVIGQANNAMLYPGLCLGAIVSRARRISDNMFAAAANAVSSLVAVRLPGASLLPHVDDLRIVSLTVAVAVAEAATQDGLAGVKFRDIVEQVGDAMWEPEYRQIRAV
jgi:malate dehydrogenase (oxaloacetate-decarboxylating)